MSQLHPELRYAIRNYFQQHTLGDSIAETLRCCETISEKKSVSRLVSWLNVNSDTTIHTGILLTSQSLIWVRRGDRSGTLLTAASLNLSTEGQKINIQSAVQTACDVKLSIPAGYYLAQKVK